MPGMCPTKMKKRGRTLGNGIPSRGGGTLGEETGGGTLRKKGSFAPMGGVGRALVKTPVDKGREK